MIHANPFLLRNLPELGKTPAGHVQVLQTGQSAECVGFDHGDAVIIQIPGCIERTAMGHAQVLQTGQSAECLGSDKGDSITIQRPKFIR